MWLKKDSKKDNKVSKVATKFYGPDDVITSSDDVQAQTHSLLNHNML